ncbi:MAG: PAC2 family protein [Candidatus Bathyarchaeia archaeon]
MSQNIFLQETHKIGLVNPILIQGLPGLGFVGKIAVDFLIDQLKPIKIAELYSTYIGLPDGDTGVRVELDGTFTLPKYEFYAYVDTIPNFILLTGDIQPVAWGQYNVANTILDFVTKHGCSIVVCLGGYSVQGRRLDLVYAVGDTGDTVEELRQVQGIQIAQSGVVKGAFGVLLGLAKQRRIKCFGLLGATLGTYPDLRAARNVLRVLSRVYRLPIELTDMDRKVEEMEARIRKLREFQSAIPQQEQPSQTTIPRGYIS